MFICTCICIFIRIRICVCKCEASRLNEESEAAEQPESVCSPRGDKYFLFGAKP